MKKTQLSESNAQPTQKYQSYQWSGVFPTKIKFHISYQVIYETVRSMNIEYRSYDPTPSLQFLNLDKKWYDTLGNRSLLGDFLWTNQMGFGTFHEQIES